ncbi:hypothetical protein EDD17DRAFT_1770889 [Pisolithus thermaeus]|nr:hypothetical protein EDD17DRAFT_1770889 [Pisolithus thermaeus]
MVFQAAAWSPRDANVIVWDKHSREKCTAARILALFTDTTATTSPMPSFAVIERHVELSQKDQELDPYQRVRFPIAGALYYDRFHPPEAIGSNKLVTQFAKMVVIHEPLNAKVAHVLPIFKIWADYITEVKMVKTSGFAQTFVDDLEAKLRPVSIEKCDILLALKKDEQKECGFPSGGEFYIWDYTKESPLLLDTRTLIMSPYLHRYYDHMCVKKTPGLYDSLHLPKPTGHHIHGDDRQEKKVFGILRSSNMQCGKETQMTTQVSSGTIASICFLAVCPDALYGNLRLM